MTERIPIFRNIDEATAYGLIHYREVRTFKFLIIRHRKTIDKWSRFFKRIPIPHTLTKRELTRVRRIVKDLELDCRAIEMVNGRTKFAIT